MLDEMFGDLLETDASRKGSNVLSLLFFRKRRTGMKKLVYGISIFITLLLIGCGREDNTEESKTEAIPKYDVSAGSLKQIDSGKLCLTHDSEWYPYEDVLFEDDYEKAGSHDFMDSRGQGFPLQVYGELTLILYNYSQRINENLLTDGWTVERIIPIGDDCYHVLMYQESSEIRIALLFDYSEMEYKILYLHDTAMPFSSEIHYISQFDWVPYGREEKATAAGRVNNPYEDIYDAEESHCLNVVIAAWERENGYTGLWKVQEFYGDVPCFSGLLVSEERMVWLCMNVRTHEYIAETFYVNEEH